MVYSEWEPGISLKQLFIDNLFKIVTLKNLFKT